VDVKRAAVRRGQADERLLVTALRGGEQSLLAAAAAGCARTGHQDAGT
jgi:hypothetical protein